LSRDGQRRKELIKAVLDAGRKSSTAAVLLHSAVAERLGLAGSDIKTLSILESFGAMTAGELAARTGLALTSVTSLIDRLEEKKLARRVRDPSDRRRVFVELNPGTVDRLRAQYSRMGDVLAKQASRYTDEQLEAIVEFFLIGADLATEETARVSRQKKM
jgi:DNA-binding MarR family transcriptional regulator